MQATININIDVIQKAKQATILTKFNTMEEFIVFLIQENVTEKSLPTLDPILQLRGKLKGKKGGTALFMKDKQAEIDKEKQK